MIYDTFLFYNELDLLELRLHELENVADRFVLVEATRTHSNQPKPLVYAENRARFAHFQERIIHVVVEDTPDTNNAWIIENFQRNAIRRGLTGCRPDDLILVSDVDEIPRADKVLQASREMRYRDGPAAGLWHRLLKQRPVTRLFRRLFKKRHPFVTVFELTPCTYYFNCVCVDRRFPATRLLHYRDLAVPQDLRRWQGRLVEDGGWHFTCLGGVDALLEKIAAFAHQEYNTEAYRDRQRLSELMNRGEYVFSASSGPGKFRFVELDVTFPVYLLQNQERFAYGIKRL